MAATGRVSATGEGGAKPGDRKLEQRYQALREYVRRHAAYRAVRSAAAKPFVLLASPIGNKPARSRTLLSRLVTVMLVLGVLYVPSFGPAMFFYQEFKDNDAYVKVVGIVYEPLLAYMHNHADSWLFDYMHWWSELAAAGDRAGG